MEIKAKCKFDLDSMKALTHLMMFKKADPKKRMIFWTVIYAVLFAIVILDMVAFGLDLTMVIVLIVCAFIIIFEYYLYFLSPKIRYKALAKMKEIENEYIFCDDMLKVFTKGGEYKGEAEIEYSLFQKVYETSKYFFIFQTNHQVFLIDKSTIEGGSVQDIRNKITAFVKDKYILCKY